MKITLNNKKTVTLLILPALFLGASLLTNVKSASLTSVSVTLSNPRLSFRGTLDGTNVVGTSQVNINTTSGQTSRSTAQLQHGDGVKIGNGATMGSYTVATVNPNNSSFTTTTPLATGQSDLNDDVISTQSGSLTVRFTTATAINNGSIRVLVPAVANDADSKDGIPDSDKYDFGFTPPTVTCPTDITNYDFGAGTALHSSVTVDGADYHAYTCTYVGTGAVGTVFNGTTNGAIVISNVINPAPEPAHATGTADTQNVIVQHLTSTATVVDSTAVAVGVIEAVRVSAFVPPTITFTITGVTASTSTCGTSTTVPTTAAAVPFGEVSLAAFNDAAQTLEVTTNAINGYVVTAIENDQLGLNGNLCLGDNTGNSCIRDTLGDAGGTMTHTTTNDFGDVASKGFAYSLHNIDTVAPATLPFEWSTDTGACAGGTYCAKQFADDENAVTEAPQPIFSSGSVADHQTVNVCYRLMPSVTNAAGNYENFITYTATATF